MKKNDIICHIKSEEPLVILSLPEAGAKLPASQAGSIEGLQLIYPIAIPLTSYWKHRKRGDIYYIKGKLKVSQNIKESDLPLQAMSSFKDYEKIGEITV